MYDREGEWHSDEDKIASIAEDYYKQLFTLSSSLDMHAVIDSVDKVVTKGMAQSLSCPYTEEEVKIAHFQMHPSKSSGPDGMSPCILLGMMLLLLYYLFYTLANTLGK